MNRRGFLGMLGGTVAAAIAAPVVAKEAVRSITTQDLTYADLEAVWEKYFRPLMIELANQIDRDVLDFHGVTHFDKLELYGNLHTVEVCSPKRRLDEECSTDVRFSVRQPAVF